MLKHQNDISYIPFFRFSDGTHKKCSTTDKRQNSVMYLSFNWHSLRLLTLITVH